MGLSYAGDMVVFDPKANQKKISWANFVSYFQRKKGDSILKVANYESLQTHCTSNKSSFDFLTDCKTPTGLLHYALASGADAATLRFALVKGADPLQTLGYNIVGVTSQYSAVSLALDADNSLLFEAISKHIDGLKVQKFETKQKYEAYFTSEVLNKQAMLGHTKVLKEIAKIVDMRKVITLETLMDVNVGYFEMIKDMIRVKEKLSEAFQVLVGNAEDSVLSKGIAFVKTKGNKDISNPLRVAMAVELGHRKQLKELKALKAATPTATGVDSSELKKAKDEVEEQRMRAILAENERDVFKVAKEALEKAQPEGDEATKSTGDTGVAKVKKSAEDKKKKTIVIVVAVTTAVLLVTAAAIVLCLVLRKKPAPSAA